MMEMMKDGTPCAASDWDCWDAQDKKVPGGGADDNDIGWDEGFGDQSPCKEQDWGCWEKWAKEKQDKLPCALEGDDECWWTWLEANPPCADEDWDCWDSWADHFFGDGKDGKDKPQPEGPPCDYADWDCVDAWAMDNQDKLPCALDDDECWIGWLMKNPPCKDEDDACWLSFLDHYFPQEENAAMCAEVVAPECGD